MKNTEDKNYTVYMHVNKTNGKKYIGITGRKPSIRWGLNGNNYKNHIYFYNSIQKYGWDNFEHEIIRNKLTKEDAEFCERWLIKKFKTFDRKFGYNIRIGGNTKTPYVVYQYDAINGIFINKYISSAIASSILNISQNGINLCCYGSTKSFCDYYFTYKNYGNKLPKNILISIQNKMFVNIAQYDLLGNFICVFRKIEDAAKLFNGSRPNIETGVSLGYIWKKVDMYQDETYKRNLTIAELDYILKDCHGKLECCKYDMKGHFICVYKNAKYAANDIGCNHFGILKACREDDGYAMGYIWKFLYKVNAWNNLPKDDPSILKWKNNNNTVFKYDSNGKFISSLKNAGEASREIGFSRSAIKNCCNKINNTVGEYIFRYEKNGYKYGKDLPSNEILKPKNYKPVSQFTLDNIYIATYDTSAEAGRSLGVNGSSINDCANGRQKTAYGFIWKFTVNKTN